MHAAYREARPRWDEWLDTGPSAAARLILAAVAVAAVAVLSVQTRVGADPAVTAARHACGPIRWTLNPTGAPAGPARAESGARAAFAQLAAASGLTFVEDANTTEVARFDRPAYEPARYGKRPAPILVAWVSPAQTTLLGIGYGRWVDTGPDEQRFVSGWAYLNRGAGTTDAIVGRLLMHELGHVMGANHSGDPADIMYPYLSAGPARYTANDRRELAAIGAAARC